MQNMHEPASVATVEETVAGLHRDWVFGWERNLGDAPFSFRERLGSFYDWSFEGVMLYDDFDPEHRVAQSPAEYGEIFEPIIGSTRNLNHRIADGPHVLVSGGLAASRLVFEARIETGEGELMGIRTTTSLVWRLTDDGWRIVREHNSTVQIPAGQVETIDDPGS